MSDDVANKVVLVLLAQTTPLYRDNFSVCVRLREARWKKKERTYKNFWPGKINLRDSREIPDCSANLVSGHKMNVSLISHKFYHKLKATYPNRVIGVIVSTRGKVQCFQS